MLIKNLFFFQIQIIAFNSDLYSNYYEAENSPRGLAGLAMFVKVMALWFMGYLNLSRILFLYFNSLLSVTGGGPESPRGHM